MTMNIDIPSLLASADRRTLAAVVTHLTGDPRAVPDLRDRAQIQELAARLLPSYLAGEKTAGPPSDEVLQAAMNLAAGEKVPAEYGPMVSRWGSALPLRPSRSIHLRTFTSLSLAPAFQVSLPDSNSIKWACPRS